MLSAQSAERKEDGIIQYIVEKYVDVSEIKESWLKKMTMLGY